MFGAKAYVLKKGPGRRKLDEKSIEGRLVGYSETAKAYRIRRNDTGIVVETRDVAIMEEPTMRTRSAVQINIDYMPPYGNDSKTESVIWDESIREESEMGPPLRRARGRPRKDKSGNRGRPAKIYRYVSESRASSRASRCDNLSADREVSPERRKEEIEDDLFEQEDDGSRGKKRPLDTSQVPVDKRARSEREASDPENSSGDTENDEFMETNFIEHFAQVADVELDEAVRGENSHEWKRAIMEEVRSHLEHGTWKLVKRPERGRVIGSKVILKNKLNAEGGNERKKARIVARGLTQRPGFDFDETFAPVAKLETIRLLAALSVEMGVKLQQMDVVTAYLHGRVDEDLYMEVPATLEEALGEIIRTERRDSPILQSATKMLQSISLGGPSLQVEQSYIQAEAVREEMV